MPEQKDIFEEAPAIEAFLKPKCPVKIGDRFYCKDQICAKNNPIEVTDIQDRISEDGEYFYVITGHHINTAVGNKSRFYDSRAISNQESYAILKKGVDFS